MRLSDFHHIRCIEKLAHFLLVFEGSTAWFIERDARTLESVSTAGLYPIGEGAGHAGGIVSAAAAKERMVVGQALRVIKAQASTVTTSLY